MSKRILLISYHFGPNSETGGFRWTQLTAALAARGWSFDVIAQGTTRAVEGNAEVRVHRLPIPAGAVRVARATENALGAPFAAIRRMLGPSRAADATRATDSASDATPHLGAGAATPPIDPARVVMSGLGIRSSLRSRVAKALGGAGEAIRQRAWARDVTALGISLAKAEAYHAVVVSSPPHLSQVAGARIARAAGLPFVPDFRDPWYLGIGASRRNADAASRAVGRWTERAVHRAATIVVHNTVRAQGAVEDDPLGAPARRTAIPNGYDAFGEPAAPDRTRFVVAFTGHLHGWMDPRVPLAAVARLLQRWRSRDPVGASLVEVTFMGTAPSFGGVPIAGLAAHYGIGDRVRLLPRGSREEASRVQEGAAVLLAYDCTHPLCVPMKFYDYARLKGRMLLLGHADGAMADAAAQLGVVVCALTDALAIDATLDAAFEGWRAGTLTTPSDATGVMARGPTVDAWERLLDALR